MDALLTTIDTLLVEPLAVADLCSRFYVTTGTSLTKACGQRPCDFLARYPARFAIGDVVARKAGAGLKAWLCAAGGAAPEARPLPAAFARCLAAQLPFQADAHLAGSSGRDTCSASSFDAHVLLLFSGMTGAWAAPIVATLSVLLSTIQFSFQGSDIPVLVQRSTNTFVECSVGGTTITVSVALKDCAEEKLTAWMRSQPVTTMHAIRLVKEWASRQDWSSPYLTPSPLFIELVTVHVATQGPTLSLSKLVEQVHALLCRAEELEITWGKWPEADATPLVLHPFSFSNIASTAQFDPTELMAFASAASSDLDAAYVGPTEPDTESTGAESMASFVSATSSTD